jgi:hypothetical protein
MSISATHLYLIVCTDDDGDDLGAVIEATSPIQATDLWRDWLLHIGMGQDQADTRKPSCVYQLPSLTGSPRFFEWASQELPEV